MDKTVMILVGKQLCWQWITVACVPLFKQRGNEFPSHVDLRRDCGNVGGRGGSVMRVGPKTDFFFESRSI
jgi:hypothetical protein